MPLFAGLNDRVQTSFCLTASNMVIRQLTTSFSETDVFKITFIAAIVITAVNSLIVSTDSTHPLRRPYGVMRQMSVITVANALMQLARTESVQDGMQQANVSFGWMPWASMLQTLTRTLLLVIGISWISGILLDLDSMQMFAPEIRRMSHAIQFMFADLLSPILHDSMLRRVVAVLGIGGIQILSRNFADSRISVRTTVYNSLAMIWTNLLIEILVPDSAQLLVLKITFHTVLVIFLGVFRTKLQLVDDLMPYVEWYIARDIVSMVKGSGGNTFDILMLAFFTACALAIVLHRSHDARDAVDNETQVSGGTSVFSTMLNVSTVLASSTAADTLVSRFDNSLADMVVGLFFVATAFRFFVQIMRSVID